MLIIGIMCIGVLIGIKFFPLRLKGWNEKLQLLCTCLLIFSMGVKLGQRENFLDDILSLGWTSFLFAIVPIIGSVVLVYFLTQMFMKKIEKKEE